MKANVNNTQLIIADAHVHIHKCFDLSKLLNSAWDNFQKIAYLKENKDTFNAILFLAEIGNENYFNCLIEQVGNNKISKNKIKNWTFHRTQEDLSLYACNRLEQKILLIAGSQIVTAEKLEVLALITDQRFEDGLPLEVTIQAIISAGGIPVLPWGVGKWIGNRGKILNNLLEESNFPILFLGDNGGRPVFWPRPSYFKQAEKKGLRILPGTDPLPLASECCRPGSFGFTIQGSLSLEEPGEHIKQMLLNPKICLEPYGSLETPFRFIRNQLAIRYGNW